MKQSASIAKLAAALVAVQGELKAVTKDALNPHFKARYASLDALTDTVRPILAKHGIALVQGGDNVDASSVAIETMLLHSSGEWVSNNFIMPLEKPTAQSAGSAISYGRRYGLSSLLALTTDEDDDGAKASAPPAKKAAAPAKPTNNETSIDIRTLASVEQRGELQALGSDAALSPPYKKRINELLAAPLTAAKADTTIAALKKTLLELTANV